MKFGVNVQFGIAHFVRSANVNTPPSRPVHDVTSDLGLALLHKITRS